MTTWQATRKLQGLEGQSVEVSLSVPELADDGKSWRCIARMTINGTSTETAFETDDAFQSLQLALGSIYLDATEKGLVGFAGAAEHGFYRLVPVSPLLHDVEAVDGAIDDLLAKFTVAP